MPSSETRPLLLRESLYEKRKRQIALTCILTVHTLHCVAFWTMYLQLWLFLKYLRHKLHPLDLEWSDRMPSTVLLIFQAVSYLLMPAIGGILGDVTLGRYKAIFVGTFFELIATACFLVTTALQKQDKIDPEVALAFTIVSLVLIAIGMGFIKANVVPFGAHQVDTGDFSRVQTFMKWYTWCLNLGQLIAYLPMVYIINPTGKETGNEDGFLIGAVIQVFAVALSIAVFIFGKPKYKMAHPEGKTTLLQMAAGIKERMCCIRSSGTTYRGINYDSQATTLILKQVILLVFLFSTLISYEGIYFQMTSTYLDQSKKLVPSPHMPVGFMYIFNPLAVLIGIPIISCLNCYNDSKPRYFVRLCIGVTFGVFSATMAGLVQYTLKPIDNVDMTNKTSVWIQVPQFAFMGMGEVFTDVAGYEISYAESPPGIEGLMMALFTSSFGAGSLLGSILHYGLTKQSSASKKPDDNPVLDEWLYFIFAIVTALMIPLILVYSRFFKLGKYRQYRILTFDGRSNNPVSEDSIHQTSFNQSDDDLGSESEIDTQSVLSSRS